MNGALVIIAFIALIAWLYHLRTQHRNSYLQSKEAYLRDILGRYPSAPDLERLVNSEEWTKLLAAYGKQPSFDNRILVLLLGGLGLVMFLVAIGATIITIYVDDELIYGAIILGAISIGLIINAFVVKHYLKKWKL